MAVADDMHNRGVGTLLLEHLVSLARSRGVRAFTAETLSENALMMQVFADAGLRAHRALADGVYDFSFPLPAGEADAALGTYRDAVAERERSADVASLRHVLTPASVAVIGASRRPGSVGRAILQNIIGGGFPGPVYAVNPGATELDGVPCVPSAAALPEQVDLAVIAAPAAAVVGIAEDCGRRGVKALVVITPGLDGAARAELLGICRRHGMRLVGPACFGVANTACPWTRRSRPTIPRQEAPAWRCSPAASASSCSSTCPGWASGSPPSSPSATRTTCPATTCCCGGESDAATKLAVLYLDSFGNPRKFARTARRVGRTIPVLTVNVGRSAAGRRLAASSRATAATPLLTRQALFEQAGMIATANLGELLDAAALLASQPVPAGAQGRRGVQYPRRRDARRRRVRRRGPAGRPPGRGYPAGAPGPAPRRCHGGRAGRYHSGGHARPLPPVPGARRRRPGRRRGPGADGHDRDQRPGPRGARRAAAGADRRGGDGPGGSGPAAARPGRGLPRRPRLCLSRVRRPRPRPRRALRRVAGDSARKRPRPGRPAPGPGEGAGRQLSRQERRGAAGCPGSRPRSCSAATACRWPTVSRSPPKTALSTAAARFGGPVAVKADVPGLVRTSDAGAVLLDLHGADEVRRGFRSLRETFGDRLAGAIVQPMITGGVKVRITVLEEQVFGPLVLFGLARATADILADRAARLAPLTESDADDLVRAVRAAPLLLGRSGVPAVDLASLRGMLLRVSQLADDLPQVAELELNPVVARSDGALALDGRVRIQAAEPADAYLRRLR